MKKLTILLLFIIIGLFSCVSTKKPDAEITLSIDLSNTKPVKLSNFFCDSVEYIKLESPEEYLIGEVSRLEITDQYIFISDRYNSQSIFIFSRNGEFISQISALGNGPFEYDLLHDFFFDESEQEIVVVSLNGRIIFYDINGNGLRQSRLASLGGMYDLMGNHIFGSGFDSEYWLHIFNIDGSNEKKFVPIGKNRIGLNFKPYTNFSSREDSLLFLPSLGQTFYCYTNGKVFPKYEVNFGKNNIPIEKFNSTQDFMEFESIFRNNNYAFNIDRFYESSGYFHFSFEYKEKLCYAFYNRSTKEITVAINLINDINGIKYYGLMGNTDDGIIQTSWPLDIKERLEELKSKMSSEEWVTYCTKNGKLVQIAKCAEDTDNPVLIIYKYK